MAELIGILIFAALIAFFCVQTRDSPTPGITIFTVSRASERTQIFPPLAAFGS